MAPTHTILAIALAVTAPFAAAGPPATRESAISSSGADSLALFERGRDAFHRAWFERADQLLRETAEIDPGLAIAHAYLAATASQLYGDPSEQVAQARATAGAASDGERLMVDALLAFTDGDYDETEKQLRSLLELYPDDRYARHALGITLVDLDRPREAIPILQALLTDDPSFVAAWNDLGYAYLDLGDVLHAEQAMTRFVANDATNPAAHDSWADIMVELGRFDEAVASLARASLLEPRYAWASVHLGDVLVKEGSLEMARAAYGRALETTSAYGPRFGLMARERIAGAWIRQLQLDEARSSLTQLIEEADNLEAPASALAAIRARLTIELVSGDGEAAAVTIGAYTDRVEGLGDAGAGLGEPSHLTFFIGWLAVVDGDLANAEALAAELESSAADGDGEALPLAARLFGELSLARLEYLDATEAFEAAGGDDPLVAVRLATAYEGDGKPAAASALFQSAATCDDFDINCALASALASPQIAIDWALPMPPMDFGPFDEEPPSEDPDHGSVRI
jgi:tetratricopeptide (TPR) repeat protein